VLFPNPLREKAKYDFAGLPSLFDHISNVCTRAAVPPLIIIKTASYLCEKLKLSGASERYKNDVAD